MNENRLEAFSNDALAIIITIMILEFKSPEESSFKSLQLLIPIFSSYVLSFIYLGIYWNNHHHLFRTAKKISGKILWNNLILLFWLSFIPFAISWMGSQMFVVASICVYGFLLLTAATSFNLLQNNIINLQEADSDLQKAVQQDKKGKITIGCFLLSIPLVIVSPWQINTH